jgi:uncharacterized protein (DUF1919 family)
MVDIKAFLYYRINRRALEAAITWQFIDKYFSWLPRSKLKNKDFSIIGNNCFAGAIYHKFGLEYTSPTVWTYIFPEEYIRFLENLEWYLKQPLEFTTVTKHPVTRKLVENMHRNYPIGILNGDVEIHFIHCKTEKQALEKWTRRVKRINFNNLFFIFSDGWEFKEELFEKFDKLPYKHKMFISEKSQIKSGYTVFAKDLKSDDVDLRSRKFEKYVDLAKWLNGKDDFVKAKDQDL